MTINGQHTSWFLNGFLKQNNRADHRSASTARRDPEATRQETDETSRSQPPQKSARFDPVNDNGPDDDVTDTDNGEVDMDQTILTQYPPSTDVSEQCATSD
jgi:hypothetical protein